MQGSRPGHRWGERGNRGASEVKDEGEVRVIVRCMGEGRS